MNWNYPTDGPWVPLTVGDGNEWVWDGVLAHRLPEPVPPPWYARLWAAAVDAIDALMIR